MEDQQSHWHGWQPWAQEDHTTPQDKTNRAASYHMLTRAAQIFLYFFRFFGVHALCFLLFFYFFHTSCPKLHCTKNREALLNVTGTTSKGKLSIITLETRLNTSKIHRNLARISESGGDLDEQTAQRHIDITA